MKSIKLTLLFIALTCTFIGCSKDGDDDSDCEDANTTEITFVNTWSTPIRVQVAYSLTPQFEAIDPIVTLDLSPGQSVIKEIKADRYQIVWKNGCPNNCSLASSYARTYIACEEYTEQLQS